MKRAEVSKQDDGETPMSSDIFTNKLDRRTLVKAAALAGVAQIASPFVITARAADEVKIGLDNPSTGTYAALGKNVLIGSQYAIEQINAKAASSAARSSFWSKISTSGDAGTTMPKRPAS